MPSGGLREGALQRAVLADERYIAHALTLRDALAKLPRAPRGAVYRGVEAIGNLDDYRPGALVTQTHFWSTSYGEDVANRFGGYAGVHFTVVGLSGRHIEALSVNPTEREVLFDSYARFRVVGQEEVALRDGRVRYEIELHEVE